MITSGAAAGVSVLDEDAPDDETEDEPVDADEVAERERQALAAEERAHIEHLLVRVRMLPPDSKCERLRESLAELGRDGYEQVMVFTQYTDTMDFLRDQLSKNGSMRLMCFSGRGGEIASADGTWRVIGRDEAKRRFRDREADILLCTDAAAEGLNFQFCGAVDQLRTCRGTPCGSSSASVASIGSVKPTPPSVSSTSTTRAPWNPTYTAPSETASACSRP